MGVPVPTGVDDLTAEWLTAAVGPCFDGASVLEVSATPVGTGQIADSVRLDLTWEPARAGPATLVTKVISSVEASRQAGLSTRTYEVEVGFYRDLAPTVEIRHPECYWTGFDPSLPGYAVVLEDLAPAQQGDQVAGCTVDEAFLAIDELALLHGPHWGDTATLSELGWLSQGGGTSSPAVGSFIEALLPGFLERYEHRLAPSVVELMQRVVPRLASAPEHDGPATVVHGDYRNDNLMFGGERVCVLDWQTVSVGPGLADLSYFLGGSLLPDDRRAHEHALVEHYRRRLADQRVVVHPDACWEGYRRFTLSGMNMAIIASMLVGRTDRGDDMFMAMAERAGLHAIDLDTEGLLF